MVCLRRIEWAHDTECRQRKWCAQGTQNGRTTQSVDRGNGAPKVHRMGTQHRVLTEEMVRPRCTEWAHDTECRQRKWCAQGTQNGRMT
ncbi:hypothetical protein KI387_011232 [Taxus chinensis]|uniref:Uncharacterized protein n=1 Tax=Taxus chinensis TaxID=29808 RepID=A0AA38KHK2_TAXCH|nr:hypothetical protein KI387_011232 [Taxus chinensis]